MIVRPGDVAFFVAIGFVTGIFAASFEWPIFVIAGVFVVVGLLAFVVSRDKKFFFTGLFSLAAVFLGASYFYFFTNVRSAAVRLPSAKGDAFTASVLEQPAASGNYLSFPVNLQSPFSGRVIVFAPVTSDIRYGDILRITGSVEPPQNARELPVAFPKQTSIISRGNGFWLKEKLLDFKSAINREFGEFLSHDEAILLGGMTLGGTSGMSTALKNEMATSETLYVTSMYGYKIAVIIAFIETMLASFVPRRVRFCLTILVAACFVIMSGGNSSAVRGGTLACALILAKDTGSIFSRRNTLVFTAAGMVILDPTIVAQAGFLFSFLSVAGMAFLAEPIRKFLRLGEGRGFLGWKEAIMLSASSLIPIIPLISAIYGSFSLTAIFANILVAPTIPLGMAAGVVLACTGFIFPYAAFFVARATSAILYYALSIIHLFAAHAIPLPLSFSSAMPFVLYYAAIGLFAYAYRE